MYSISFYIRIVIGWVAKKFSNNINYFEDKYAFHYQTIIGKTPLQEWKSWSIDLSEHIIKALEIEWESGNISNVLNTLKLYQLEFVIEVKNAEGAAMIDNFFVKETSEI